MTDKWYFSKGEKKLGPYSSMQLKELADKGKILPSDTVWKEGIERGVPAAKVKHLFSAPPAQTPPAQASPAASSSGAITPPPSAGRKEQQVRQRAEPETAATGSAIADSDAEQTGAESVSPEVPAATAATPLSAAAHETGKESGENQTPPPQGGAPAAPPASPKPEVKRIPAGTLPQSTRSFRISGVRGAIVLGQDAMSVRYRKKCPKCGTEDNSVRTMVCRSGINRDRYFCQKCKKLQQVEIHGTL